MLRVIMSDTAKADLLHQITYIRKQNPAAALRQRQRVSHAVALLRGSPGLGGRPGRVEGTRELVVTGTPFVVIFQVNAHQIEILHILHGRQQWPTESTEAEDSDEQE